ncbi:MAG: hypothetical protein IPH96_18165 [Saprospiraceae bacterium]|nr:hypothetical protein [Saprospiraceae bacterium]
MKDKVRNSFSSFTDLEQENLTDNIVNNYQEGVSCDTKFIYKFDSDGKAVAEQGINDLHNAIPFVLSFVEKLSTIIVNEETQQTIYSHQTIKQYDKVTIERITKKIADIDIEENIFIAKISSKHEALTIAIQLNF